MTRSALHLLGCWWTPFSRLSFGHTSYGAGRPRSVPRELEFPFVVSLFCILENFLNIVFPVPHLVLQLCLVLDGMEI